MTSQMSQAIFIEIKNDYSKPPFKEKMAYKRHLFILILLFIQDKEKFLFIQDKERYYTEEEKDSQRVFSLYFGVPHLREYLFNVNIHICEILSSREKGKETLYRGSEGLTTIFFSLFWSSSFARISL